MLNASDLRPYQNEMVDFILSNPFAMLWVDVGLGKTVSVLTALQSLPGSTLIVAPSRVTKLVWRQEQAKWNHCDKQIYLIEGNPDTRMSRLNERDEPIHLISSSLLHWFSKQKTKDYDNIVIDESHELKNNSQRTKAMLKLRRKMPDARMVQMTGTPSEGEYEDLFYQFKILDGGQRLFKTKQDFYGYFFNPFCSWKWEKPTLKPNADKAIQKRINDVVLRLDAKDHLQLTDIVYNRVPVELPRPAMKMYKHMEKEFFLKLEDEIKAITNNKAGRNHKLRQICNGFVYDTDEDTSEREAVPLHSAKFRALNELITSIGKPVIVVYEYIPDRESILALVPGAQALTDDNQDDWNAGRIPVLALNCNSGGTGLNLQHGGHNLIWLSESWSLKTYLQTNGRLHRKGQKNPVIVHHLSSVNTIEDRIRQRREQKHETMAELLQAVKDE